MCLCAAHGSQRTSCGKRFSFCHVGPMPHTQATSAFTHGAISPPFNNTPCADGVWAARGSSISIISACSECFELGSLWEADTF